MLLHKDKFSKARQPVLLISFPPSTAVVMLHSVRSLLLQKAYTNKQAWFGRSLLIQRWQATVLGPASKESSLKPLACPTGCDGAVHISSPKPKDMQKEEPANGTCQWNSCRIPRHTREHGNNWLSYQSSSHQPTFSCVQESCTCSVTANPLLLLPTAVSCQTCEVQFTLAKAQTHDAMPSIDQLPDPKRDAFSTDDWHRNNLTSTCHKLFHSRYGFNSYSRANFRDRLLWLSLRLSIPPALLCHTWHHTNSKVSRSSQIRKAKEQETDCAEQQLEDHTCSPLQPHMLPALSWCKRMRGAAHEHFQKVVGHMQFSCLFLAFACASVSMSSIMGQQWSCSQGLPDADPSCWPTRTSPDKVNNAVTANQGSPTLWTSLGRDSPTQCRSIVNCR